MRLHPKVSTYSVTILGSATKQLHHQYVKWTMDPLTKKAWWCSLHSKQAVRLNWNSAFYGQAAPNYFRNSFHRLVASCGSICFNPKRKTRPIDKRQWVITNHPTKISSVRDVSSQGQQGPATHSQIIPGLEHAN